MIEISYIIVAIYAIKGRGKRIKFYRLPIGDKNATSYFLPLLESANADVNNNTNTVTNYDRIINISVDDLNNTKYYFVEGRSIAAAVTEKISQPLLHKMKNLKNLRSRASNSLLFSSILVTVKKSENTFMAGIINIKPHFMLYRIPHIIFRIFDNRYSVLDNTKASSILIPKNFSILINGRIDEDRINIEHVYFKKQEYKFFERLFAYKDFWVSEANINRAACRNNLEINEEAWNKFLTLPRARKFAIAFRDGLTPEHIATLEDYKNERELHSKLKFDIVQEGSNKRVKIDSVEGLKDFMDCYQKKILSLKNEWYRVGSKEQIY